MKLRTRTRVAIATLPLVLGGLTVASLPNADAAPAPALAGPVTFCQYDSNGLDMNGFMGTKTAGKPVVLYFKPVNVTHRLVTDANGEWTFHNQRVPYTVNDVEATIDGRICEGS